MKVLLINSPLFKYAPKHYDEDSLPPIGLGYIATYLQKENILVDILDCVAQRISLSKLRNKINKIKPDFLATNIFSTNYLIVKDLIESLKFKTHVIIGGLSTKTLLNQILKWDTNNQIDIVIGDGELITSAIIKKDIRTDPFMEEKNRRVFKIDTESSYFIQDISSIYLNRDVFSQVVTKNYSGINEISIVTSRGCIYNCTFCLAAQSINKDFSIRERSKESIIEELSDIKRKYPFNQSIRILDDLFLKSSNSLSKAINIFSQFDFQWRSMAHIRTFNNVSHEDLIALKKSGCNELFIGIESGSPAILKSINKTHNIDLIINNLSKIFNAGINVKGYFIYGFPGESKEQMESTYQLALKLKSISQKYNANFRTSVFQFRPYQGTTIYNVLQKKYPGLNIDKPKYNWKPSILIGKERFNFNSNNFSKASLKFIHDYICITNMI